jgi:SAM-dependent methyltransferase
MLLLVQETMTGTWDDLRKLEPVSRSFGLDRGTPVDRYYIEGFLEGHRDDIAGRVMEVGDSTYTRRFGGDRVTRSDVLHTPPGGKSATVVGDFETGNGIPTGAFDCIILTQVLPFIFDVRAAVANVHAALRPGGLVLATVPCISQISQFDMERWGDFWRFTSLSARRLFEEAFVGGEVQAGAHGNALAATAFLQGMAAEELTGNELDYHDPAYQVIVTIRARRAQGRA